MRPAACLSAGEHVFPIRPTPLWTGPDCARARAQSGPVQRGVGRIGNTCSPALKQAAGRMAQAVGGAVERGGEAALQPVRIGIRRDAPAGVSRPSATAVTFTPPQGAVPGEPVDA